MRPLLVGCALLLGALAVLAHSPSLCVNAQEKPAAAQPSSRPPAKVSPQASSAIDPQKEARIRELIEVTGAKNLGQQLIEAGMEQFRSSVQDSQPNNPRAKQFADAFVARFQKHFDPDSLTEHVIPIYDKYLTTEDLKGLLDYYRSPLGQRKLKAPAKKTSAPVSQIRTEAGRLSRKTLLDFQVDTERPVVIAQRHDRHIAVYVEFHLDHLLLRGTDIRHIRHGKVSRHLLLHRHTRRRVLRSSRRAHRG